MVPRSIFESIVAWLCEQPQLTQDHHMRRSLWVLWPLKEPLPGESRMLLLSLYASSYIFHMKEDML